MTVKITSNFVYLYIWGGGAYSGQQDVVGLHFPVNHTPDV